MGIVMCLMMAVSLLLICPLKTIKLNPFTVKSNAFKIFSILVLLAGCWNALWYGANHLNSFWGNVSIGSGSLMIMAAFFALFSTSAAKGNTSKFNALMKSLECLVSVGLLGFLVLYFVTIIRLNLGLPILQ